MPSPSAAPAVRLHTVSAGHGPLVVCLHSSGSSSAQWRRLAESAQDSFRFLAVDLHGHGRSQEYAGGDYALRCESEAVWNSIEAARGPVHLVGHSYGGAVALDLAVRRPGRFASVTVFEPVLFGLLGRSTAEYREIAAVGSLIARAARAGELEMASAAFIDYWNGSGSWRGLPAEHQDRVRARIVPVGLHFEALLANPLSWQQLLSLQAPLVLLRGDRSPAPARAVCDRLARLPHATTEVFSGLGHMAPVTHPALVNARISAHLDAATRTRLAA